jgi:hypothetical protein
VRLAGAVEAIRRGDVHAEYERILRPMFPLDKDMKDPDLTARLVPSSDE